ncbi:MAG: acetoacetate--CoA ligase, partial [Pseudomonadota bacterium]
MIMPEMLWEPSQTQIEDHNLWAFMKAASEKTGKDLMDYDRLHDWSITDIAAFWDLVWDHCGIIGEKGARALVDADRMMSAKFFPDASLNYAENLMRKTGGGDALVFRGEDKIAYRWSHDELHQIVSRLQQAMTDLGIGEGDRVAAMMPNLPETVALMLAATSLGAIWCSCSPDFGERGVLDRFQQIEPKLFICCDGYYYNGKRLEIADKLRPIADGLPSAENIVVVPYIGIADTVAEGLPRAKTLDALTAGYEPKPVTFKRLPFRHPLYILFSSGTTGVPKCIVHSAGGTLIQHLKEHVIINGFKPNDRVFFFTTCGWMMWNWLVSGLAAEASLMLYDGSPFAPSGTVLFDYAQDEKFTYFGTSAKFIDALKKAELSPGTTHDLSAMRSLCATGSPLAPEGFRYIYSDIKKDMHLASMSGGTDIVSCFVTGVPSKPVHVGEIQGAGLG